MLAGRKQPLPPSGAESVTRRGSFGSPAAILRTLTIAALLVLLGPPKCEGQAGGSIEAEPGGAVPNAPSSRITPQRGTVPYDIVYVRAPRFGDEQNTRWPEVSNPFRADPGADLVLLRPDGAEEVLVEGGRDAVTDPFVSFDGKWIYFAKFHDTAGPATRFMIPAGGADIYRIHVETRAIERLTHGE
jgi:hypothetical protein